MKKILLLLMLCGITSILFAQAPQKFSYQAVAVDATGSELRNQDICLRASVLSGSISGTEEWVEVHDNVTTDDFGLFTIDIGDGMPIAGAQNDFMDIPWGGNVHYLKMEMSLNNLCTDFVLVGTNQLLSVPYALYADRAGYANTSDEANHSIYSDTSLFASQSAFSDSSSVAFNSYLSVNATYSDTAIIALTSINDLSDDDGDPQNEIQELSYSGDTVFLSNSTGFIPLFQMDPDHDPENEIQELELNGSMLSLSLGNGSPIDLNSGDGDTNPTNEIQELELNGTTLSLSGSSTSVDIQSLDPDHDPENEIQELLYDDVTSILSITGGSTSIDLANLPGYNASGASLDFPQGVGVGGVGFEFFPDEVTVPADKVLYIVASEDEILLPGYGNNFGRHLTGPNLPMFKPGTELDNCRCIGFYKPYDPFFEPLIIVLEANEGNFYQVPPGKNFILKSGIDATTPLTLNGFTISPFGTVMKAFAVPDGVQIKNLGNDEVILTGYLFDK